MCKTLIRKSSKTYVSYSLGFIWDCELPVLLMDTATIESLVALHDAGYGEKELDGTKINWNDFEIINVIVRPKITVSEMRELDQMVSRGEISYSRMVEILNGIRI